MVTAALHEDAQDIAVRSCQGGHVGCFKYMVDLLKARGGAHINVFEAPMDAVRSCSLGQITEALFEVGRQCRRSSRLVLKW